MAASIDVRPSTPTIGADVFGVDLAQGLGDPTVVGAIRTAFLDRHVPAFRKQQLDHRAHLAIGRLFGVPDVHPSRRGPDVDDQRRDIARCGYEHRSGVADPVGSPPDRMTVAGTSMPVAFEGVAA